jgi:DNA-binding winged helix-turn-helix (wHTH) protein
LEKVLIGEIRPKVWLIEYTCDAMAAMDSAARYRFGVFEANAATGELRRQGIRVKLNTQPFQMLMLLLSRPGELVTREDITRELWPEGTFVDFEHGVNSAVNRIREALGDKASNPRFVETVARKGYRFIAPVEKMVVGESVRGDAVESGNGFGGSFLATEADLPRSSYGVVQTLFVLLQVMYVAFYVGALANLAEIEELMSPLPHASVIFLAMVMSAGMLIAVRAFVVCAALFHAPGFREKFLKLWPFLLLADIAWSLAPFLLLHHISVGVAVACTALLVYSPFAQRALVLMGAGKAKV